MKNSRKTSLQRRFFIFTLTASLVILVVALGLSYASSLSSVAQSTQEYLGTYIEHADQMFAQRMSNVRILTHTIASDRQIVQAATTVQHPVASYDWFTEQLRMRSYLDGLIADKSYVQRLVVVMNNGSLYHSSDELIQPRDLEPQVMDAALKSTGMRVTYDPRGFFYVTQPIRVKGESQGAIYMELDAGALFSEYDLRPLDSSRVMLFDRSGSVLFACGPEPGDVTEEMIWQSEGGVNFFGGEGWFILRKESAGYEMTVVAMLTLGDLLVDALATGQWMLVLLLGAAIVVAGLAWIFSRQLFGNLNILMECMRAVRKGNLTCRARVSTRDEISEAADTFNDMMDKIKNLMEDIRAQEAAKRAAEQQMLETQIQPHFVYNAISAMRYAAQMRGQRDIEQAAGALGELMRSVLGNHDEWITLWEEKAYIEQYVVLQKFKFQNEFLLRWDVPEKLWGMRLPKLLIQPLVENALIHGIHQRKAGEIVVSAVAEKDRVVLRVTDNGKGMEAEQVADLMEKPAAPATMRRIGINNVRQRIALCYEGRARFGILSIPGNFTCVEMELPYTEGGEDYGHPGSAG